MRDHEKPSADFRIRYNAAKAWRRDVEPDLKEALRFCAPHRANDFSQSPHRKNTAETDTYTSIGEENATDLAGDLVNYFMPSEQKWTDYEVMSPVNPRDVRRVDALVEQRRSSVFNLLDQSSFNDRKPQLMFEAACHGTPSLWVEAGHITDPLWIDVVMPHELLITPGHQGILDRFREGWRLAETLPALLPGMNLSAPEIARKMEKPGSWVKVCWGFWLDWSDIGNPIWRREVTVDGRLVSERKQGIGPFHGGCPLLVGRFNPTAGRPWGRGPGIKAIPDLNALDKIEEVILSKLDEQLDPAWTYPDDGVLDLSSGIQGGMAYARRGELLPEPMIAPINLDYGWFSQEEMKERIRTAFYQDGPRQRGDTPPTASQWLDERRRVQSRLGKPSAPIFTELCAPLVRRVEFIATALGLIEGPITLDGRSIHLAPISPLQRSQDQDKALTTRSNLELAMGAFGDQVYEIVDGVGTFQNIAEATGDELIVFRDQESTGGDQANTA